MIRNLNVTFLLAVTAIIALGCSNTMNTPENRFQLGAKVNVAPDDIIFLSWCGFTVSADLSEDKRFRIGRVLLSEAELIILPSNKEIELMRVKYSEMQGVHLARLGLGKQIQVRINSEYLVLEIANDLGAISHSGSKKIFEELIKKGVPEIDTGAYLINTRAGEWFIPPIPI